MTNPLFTGVCTALVTPFLHHEINYPMLQRLIERQIEAGIEALVICGTTGESATLSDAEKIELVEKAKQYARGRCLIIAGTGSNSTDHMVKLSLEAEKAGADGLLVVTPYYNKADANGLRQHFLAAAKAVSVPIILYNVPSRTGVDISAEVCAQLSAVPRIVGIKEAGTDLTKITKMLGSCTSAFSVWSGNDDLTVPIMAMGGKGVISVASNLVPELMQMMAKAALDGDFDTASALQIELQPLIQALFAQVNPIPVKAAMKLIGYNCGGCRLPLTEVNSQVLETLRSILLKE